MQRGDRGGEIKIILGKFAPDRVLVELTFCEEGVTVGAVLAGHRGCLGYGRYDRYSQSQRPLAALHSGVVCIIIVLNKNDLYIF